MKTPLSLAVAVSLFLATVAAHAAISDCEELKQSGIKDHLDKCVAQATCNFVLSIKPNCTEGRRFLERTKGKALSANDVFDANLPEVDHPQDWKDRFTAVREKVAASGIEVQSGRIDGGDSWVYQGDVQDGKRQGWGVFFWSSGTMFRGQFVQNWRTGKGEYALQNGHREVGTYLNNLLDGEAWVRGTAGPRVKGSFSKGKVEGAGTYLFPNGNLYSGNFVANNFNGHGILRWADGSSFEGNFTNDKMDGQGTYTSTSGVKSARTYNAGALVANAAPATASVGSAAACESSHTTCSAICVAGGLVALFSRSRSDSGACTDICTSTRQQCLAALAPAPSPSQATTSSGSSNPAVAGKSCKEILNSLIGPVNDAAATARLSPAQAAQDTVWAMQTYLRVANTHPACANDTQSKQQVASMLRQEQDKCRRSGSSGCESGQNFSGTAARTEVAIRQLFQEAENTRRPDANTTSAGSACVAAVDQQEARFRPITQRIANTPGAVAQMQMSMGMLNERITLLDELCRDQPLYATRADNQQQLDSTWRACMGIANNPSDCGSRPASGR